MHISNSQQLDIFSDDQHKRHYAELCNALYERELASLSQQKFSNASLLQRKIAGLRHLIKRAAYNLLQHTSPLQVDIHNASWQAKQAAKCMANNFVPEKTQAWFCNNVQIGRRSRDPAVSVGCCADGCKRAGTPKEIILGTASQHIETKLNGISLSCRCQLVYERLERERHLRTVRIA